MKKIIIFISIIFVFVGKGLAQQQYCDCPYPIIFVHGINSNNKTWDTTTEYLSPFYGEPEVLSFNLNSVFGQTNTNYVNDVTWVSNQNSIKNACIYTINFDTLAGTPIESASNESAITKQGYALKMAIEAVIQETGKSKVILVGHSMGGLASRDYLQRWADSNDHHVAKLFTLGTPHLGTNAPQLTTGITLINLLNERLSEASRDLALTTKILQNNELVDVPGYYLFGGDESKTQFLFNSGSIPLSFNNDDVNCNGTILENILGINEGTIVNPLMPLPLDIKYTYYISNINQFCDPPTNGYGCDGDGPVDDKRMWLYTGGDGSTHNFINELSIPFPNDTVNHRLSDRLTSKESRSHLGQTSDYKNIFRGLDEADFPYFAYEVNIDKAYSGMSQKRADIVAENSNTTLPGLYTNHDPFIDSDWYKVVIDDSHSSNFKLIVNKPANTFYKVDFYKSQVPEMYSNQDPLLAEESKLSPEYNNDQIVLDLGSLLPNEYYFRITSKVNILTENDFNTYSFRIHDPSVCTNPSPQLVSEDCGFLTHEKAIKLNGEIGLDYTIQTIPDIGQNGHFVDCGFPLLLEDVENKTPLKVIVTNTLNPTCTQTLDILPSESNCDFFGLGLCYVPDLLLTNRQKSVKKIFCDNAICDILPINPLGGGNRTAMSTNSDLPSALQVPVQRLYVNYLFEEAALGKKIGYFGSLLSNENFDEIRQVFTPFFDNNLPISVEDSMQIQSELGEFDISEFKVARLITKWNNSLIAWSNNVYSPDSIYPFIMDKTTIDSFQTIMDQAIDYSQNNGFSSLDSMYNISFNTISNYSLANDPTINPVCASVGISLSQKLTMTREAFEGTLKIFNGATTGAMDSIALHLEIKNESGVLSNHLFEIDNTSLTALTGISGTGQLAANTEGIAKILFIPEKDAAPIVPRFYSFGGSISYIDPFSNLKVTMPLVLVTLQVNPSPDLFLHYFMQRDIFGDDAFTANVEPSVPARLAVMIENDGYGTAQNVRIQSAQPQVIDNEKGLALQMNLIGSRLQGGVTNWGLNNIDFGSIPPLSTRVGEWLFTSNLLGHFTGYSTNVRHVSSRGNPDLSLISGAQLHELIHSIKIYGAQDDDILDFLTNEVQDANDHPDAIFASRGNTVYNVKEAVSGQFLNAIQFPTFTTTLQVTPQDSGWFYLKLNDPGQGEYNIVSVTRNSDGQVIPLENAWLTYVTIPDTKIQKYEDKFHMVDVVPNNTTRTYTVVWSPKDPNPPKVDTILNVPQTIVSVPHTLLRVKFNKPIEDSTFTVADLNLTRQGGANLINNTVSITKLDSVTYEVTMGGLTDLSGYYVFTAQATVVTDKTGVPGTVGKSVSWIQNLSGPVVVSFEGIVHNATYQQIDTVLITFNLPIDTSFISPASFRLMQNNVYQGDTLGVSLADNTFRKFRIVGLAALTDSDNLYKIVVNLGAVKTTTGIAGQDSQFVQFTIDQTGPIITSLNLITESALDNQHKTGALVSLDQVIIGLVPDAFTLSKNGSIIEDSLITIQQISPTSYKLFWGAESFGEGEYEFLVSADILFDLYGSSGQGNDSLLWVVNRTTNLAIESIYMVPDLGYSSTDKVTSNRNITLHYTFTENAYQVKVKYIANGIESTLISKPTAYDGLQSDIITFPIVGNIALKIEARDTFGNYIDTIFPVFIDELDLTGSWLAQQNEVLFSHPDSILFDFKELVFDAGPVPSTSFQLYRNNVSISNHNLNFVRLNDTLYRLEGTNSISIIPGNYRVDLQLSAFSKYLTGRSGSGIVSFYWEIFDPNLAPVANAGPDQIIKDLGEVYLNGSGSYDPDNNNIQYKWISLNSVSLSNDTLVSPTFLVNESHVGKMLSFLLIVADSSKSSSDLVRIFVELDDILVKTKVFLQGPYVVSEELMKDSLRSKALIPFSTPYINTVKYKYGNDGKEINSDVLSIVGSNAIVDWVYLELFSITADSVVGGGSYLLQRNGNIVDTLVTKIPIFENLQDGEYALRIYHRNHIPIMTSDNVLINQNEIKQIDLTQDVSKILGGINAVKLISGKYTMFSGDANINGQIQQTDINQTLPKIGQAGYKQEDIDMNGEIQNIDIQLYILPNLGRGKQF